MPRSLYSPADHHDACGVGFVATLTNLPSHDIVAKGLEVLVRLDHRGAIGADGETGDGCGITVQLPDAFLHAVAGQAGVDLPAQGDYALGTVFLPRDATEAGRATVDRVLREERIPVLWWRDVPTEPDVPGPIARQSQPAVVQVVVARPDGVERGADFERALYIARRRVEREAGLGGGQVVAFSSRTTVYKGMLTPAQLAAFYPDLRDPRFKSALAMVHSRFSTNTMPQWPLAQPFRTLCHNGEINTIRGNRTAWRSREAAFFSSAFGRRLKEVLPTLAEGDSDSKSLDGALELLVHAGWPLPQAVMALVPEAWEHAPDMDPARRAFYQAFACALEPWDGPATIQFTDGEVLGAVLDRNGLRPSRYVVTSGGLVVLSSETGVLDLDPATIVEKGRLEPGKMLLLDLGEGRIIADDALKAGLATDQPYDAWLARHLVHLGDLPECVEPDGIGTEAGGLDLGARLRLFGVTREDIGLLIAPLAGGKEAVGSMGDDTPIAALSERPRLLFDRFRQRFAQVTNPPLDAIREHAVTSLITHLGETQNVLEPGPELCRRLRLEQPVLTPADLARVRAFGETDPAFRTATLDATLGPDEALAQAVERLVAEAVAAIDARATILVVSDAAATPERPPVPSLLATGAVHHGLIRRGLRTFAELVVETGDAREVHHVAALVGYGAAAVCPTLLLDVVRELSATGHVDADPESAVDYTVKALGKGLLKVLSKMGISTLRSYQGAQTFEILGLADDVVEAAFAGTPSRVGGAGFADLDAEVRARAATAGPLPAGGRYQWRRGGEHHAWGPTAIVRLQEAVRADVPDGRRHASFAAFSAEVDDLARRRSTLRSLLDLVDAETPVDLDAVEPWTDIVTRFKTGAMSYGSISREAHETLAVAMNRIGGKSNTGEGGEAPPRHAAGHPARSRIKQIASGRFGVTAEYLATADELQIKMAQGAKPGEGGQLPGFKVVGDIAVTRHATPGVGLISPPPHHDIYSIEDLAQLIFDLKTVNPAARVSVKLVSEAGIGTVAAGVAKAGADTILVSGSDGGTGAAAQTSIAHAGLPWELGLAEVQQALCATGLRERVRLEVDGHLKTGRDVVIGALLGADEFGFATAPLVAMGCVMMRKCHLNACPVGIATQDPTLRSHFAGTPEHVVEYVHQVAEAARVLLARLGFTSLAQARGRVDRLRQAPASGRARPRRRPGPRPDARDPASLRRSLPGRARVAGRPPGRPPLDPGRARRRPADRGGARHRQRRPRVRDPDQRRDRAPHRGRGPAPGRRHRGRPGARLGRAEPGRVRGPGPDDPAGGRRQRLRGQGALGRPAGDPPAGRVGVCTE